MFLARDKILLEAFKRGEKSAMERVYEHYRRGVTVFLRKGFTFRSGSGSFYFKGITDPSELDAAKKGHVISQIRILRAKLATTQSTIENGASRGKGSLHMSPVPVPLSSSRASSCDSPLFVGA